MLGFKRTGSKLEKLLTPEELALKAKAPIKPAVVKKRRVNDVSFLTQAPIPEEEEEDIKV
jgi:hypothetical protein